MQGLSIWKSPFANADVPLVKNKCDTQTRAGLITTRPTTKIMAYFSPRFLEFFRELETHNNSEWFADNRSTYEMEVKKPFQTLVQDVINLAQQADARVVQRPQDAIFRINRDIRFSNDKRPYKEHVAAVISRHGKKSPLPAFFLQLGGKEVWLGGGAYEVDKDALARIRSEMYYNTEEWKAVLQAPAFVKYYGGQVLGDKNKVVPSPYKEALAEVPFLANKQFYHMATLPADIVLADNLLDIIHQYMNASQQMNHFLEVAMLNVEE